MRTLQAVDELVESVVNRVDELGLMDNTYIIYTSDNGFHVGQHRMQPGKSCAYEEDINIPLIVRGPDIAKKAVQNVPTTHTDWVPTILKLAGIDDNHGLDGTPIPLTNDIKPIKHEHVSVEFWGNQHFEGKYHSSKPSNTYKSLRIIGDDYSLSYTVWCTNEHELYDMSADSQQMDNLLGTSASSQNIKVGSKTYPVPQVHGRVDALVQVLRTCNGTVCVHPWQKLHPDGNVSTLVDAMDSTYDNFYTQKQVKMKFDKCLDGYFPDNEGPRPIAYGGNRIDSRDYGDWSDWTLGDIDYGDDDWADWT